MQKDITEDIEKCLNIVKEEWLNASDLFPDFLPEIPYEIKIQNEQYIKSFSEDFQKQIKSFSRLPIRQKKWKQKTLNMLSEVLYHETIINIHQSMKPREIDLFQAELEEFLRHARTFAPELSFEEIGQAIRNYIVYAMFKEIHQVKTGFSNAGFGYSMLYPFTDNYIDNNEYSASDKVEYNQLIRDKIAGKEVHPRTDHQQKTCDLLQAIETEYPRENDSTVFTLLHMMLDAQEESIRQQQKGSLLTTEERLNISLYKGGISVLIDRFLVGKELTEEELIFYLGMGFFLQLADDLQDIKSDSELGYQTLLTVSLSYEEEEKAVNKIIHFILHIMEAYHAENNIFKNFVLSNCCQLIFTSIGGSKEFFSKEYINRIEKYLPVTYAFLEASKKNILINQDVKVQQQYINLMDHIIFQ